MFQKNVLGVASQRHTISSHKATSKKKKKKSKN